jgi:hypothetical protein
MPLIPSASADTTTPVSILITPNHHHIISTDNTNNPLRMDNSQLTDNSNFGGSSSSDSSSRSGSGDSSGSGSTDNNYQTPLNK